MSLTPPPSVQKLQIALHAKAKGSPTYRFYALYDKLYRSDVLAFAYACCKSNKGAAGVDGQTFEDIEKYGWVKDRVAQTAAVLVLGAIFEADLPPEQHAYRPEHSALDAISHVYKLLNTGHEQVVDADLSGYFDSIPHAELMLCVGRRVSDGAMLHLIKMWLEAPVEETDDRGGKHRTTRNRDEGRGTPQGSPISPLLSNLYMRRFVLGWKALGHQRRLRANIVNYADDLVICCRGCAEQAMRTVMSRLKVTVNEAKTHVCRMPQDTFDFLGYTFGWLHSPRTGGTYLGATPSCKRVVRVCEEVSRLTDHRTTGLHGSQVVGALNQIIEGSAWGRSAGPTARWSNTPAGGCVGGWLTSSRYGRG